MRLFLNVLFIEFFPQMKGSTQQLHVSCVMTSSMHITEERKNINCYSHYQLVIYDEKGDAILVKE
jgi:hypothetical protein